MRNSVKHLGRIIYAALLVLLLIAGIGRIIPLPFFVFIVSGKSMLPTFHPGDLVLAVRDGYRVGDVVVWCSSPLYCVAHRVQEVKDNTIITKGDANPVEDPPIPVSIVKYRVVYAIPNYVWLTPLLSLIIYLGYRKIYTTTVFERKRIRGKEVLKLTTTIVIIFILLDIVVLALTPLPVGSVKQYIPKPMVELRRLEKVGFNVILNYTTRFTRIVGVNLCLVKVSDKLFNCEEQSVEGNVLTLKLPKEAYQYAYFKDARRLSVLVNVSLSNGWFMGNYSLPVFWRKLLISINETMFEIYNPNPISFNLSVKILYVNQSTLSKPPHVIVEEFDIILIEPYSKWVYVFKEESGYAYVELEYVFRGVKVFERRKIIFD